MALRLKNKTVIQHRSKRDLLRNLPRLATVEASAAQELTEVQRLFRESRAGEKARKEGTTDAAHYICLTFSTADRAKAYAAAKGWSVDLHTFVDGAKVAAAEGIELPPIANLVPGKHPSLKNISRIRKNGGEVK